MPFLEKIMSTYVFYRKTMPRIRRSKLLGLCPIAVQGAYYLINDCENLLVKIIGENLLVKIICENLLVQGAYYVINDCENLLVKIYW